MAAKTEAGVGWSLRGLLSPTPASGLFHGVSSMAVTVQTGAGTGDDTGPVHTGREERGEREVLGEREPAVGVLQRPLEN